MLATSPWPSRSRAIPNCARSSAAPRGKGAIVAFGFPERMSLGITVHSKRRLHVSNWQDAIFPDPDSGVPPVLIAIRDPISPNKYSDKYLKGIYTMNNNEDIHNKRELVSCSFCNKSHKEVGPLAEGPNRVYICYPCVKLCAKIIEGECRYLGIDLKRTHD
jgi:hypothetical protein